VVIQNRLQRALGPTRKIIANDQECYSKAMEKINSFEYVALFSGVLFGFFYLRHIGVVRLTREFYYYFVHRSRDKFYKLYDSHPLDDELIFGCLKTHRFSKNYIGYLRCHEDARPGAYDDFRIYYVSSRNLIIKRFIQAFVLPCIIFWSWWYLYLIGISVVFILLIIYSFVKIPDFERSDGEAIVLLIIIDYILAKRKAKKVKGI